MNECQHTGVDAGAFGEWLARARASLRGDAGMEVPCGDCVGCCTSGYSVQVRPEDRAAIALIPFEWLVRPSGFDPTHRTLPPRPDGVCRMMEGGKCTIYAARPQTCLDYDCRVFAAAGLEAGPGKERINQRIRAWRFSYQSADDRRAHDAVLAAAQFLQSKRDCFGAHPLPASPMGIAVLAIKVYAVFLDAPHDDAAIAQAIIAAQRQFDQFEK